MIRWADATYFCDCDANGSFFLFASQSISSAPPVRQCGNWRAVPMAVPSSCDCTPQALEFELSAVVDLEPTPPRVASSRSFKQDSKWNPPPPPRAMRPGSEIAFKKKAAVNKPAQVKIRTRPREDARRPGTSMSSLRKSPASSRKLSLASDGRRLRQTRPWLGLADISRIPSGLFSLLP